MDYFFKKLILHSLQLSAHVIQDARIIPAQFSPRVLKIVRHIVYMTFRRENVREPDAYYANIVRTCRQDLCLLFDSRLFNFPAHKCNYT